MIDVREEPGVQADVDAACRKWPRAQDAWDTVVWTIARDPGKGTPVTESGLTRVLDSPGARSIGMPSVWALYVVEPNLATICAIRFTEAPYTQAGHA